MNQDNTPYRAMVVFAIWAIVSPFLLHFFIGPVLYPPPFAYISENRVSEGVALYYPLQPTICQGQGEAIQFPLHIVVSRVPTTIYVDDQLRNDTTGRTALSDVMQWPDSSYTRTVDISRTLAITIPASIPVGTYTYVFVATSEASEPIGFEVPFSIKDCNP